MNPRNKKAWKHQQNYSRKAQARADYERAIHEGAAHYREEREAELALQAKDNGASSVRREQQFDRGRSKYRASVTPEVAAVTGSAPKMARI